MRTLFTQVAGLRVFTAPDTTTPVLATLPLGYQVTDLQPTTAPPAGWLQVEVTPPGATALTGYMLDTGLTLTVPATPAPTGGSTTGTATPTQSALRRWLPWIIAVVLGLAMIALFVIMVMRGPAQPVDVQATAQAIVNAMLTAQPPTATPGTIIITATPNPAMPTVAPTAIPPTAVPPTSVPPVQPTSVPSGPTTTGSCTFPASGNLDNMPKTVIELAPAGQWFHRVFNTRLFNAANNWGGADSWFVTLALGPNSGGSWTSHGNPGQIVYRGTSTQIQWCLGVLTTATWKSQFMDNSTTMPAAINVRIVPNSVVTVVTASGKTVQQATSDAGDITVILPDSGTITISVSYSTAAPTHESLVWWGPYDRSQNINTIDAR